MSPQHALAHLPSSPGAIPDGHDIARARLRSATARRAPVPATVFVDPTPSLPTPAPLCVRPVGPPCISQWWADVLYYARISPRDHDADRPWSCNIYLDHALVAISRAYHDPADLLASGRRRTDSRHPTVRCAWVLQAWRDDRTLSMLAGRDSDPHLRVYASAKLDVLEEFLFDY